MLSKFGTKACHLVLSGFFPVFGAGNPAFEKIASRPPDASVVRNVPRTVRDDVLCGRGPEWVNSGLRMQPSPELASFRYPMRQCFYGLRAPSAVIASRNASS